MGIRKITALSFGITLFWLCGSVNAQQPAKVYRIGLLRAGSVSSDKDRVNAFREGLRELGYVEGKNLVIEYGYADGNRDAWPKIAAEMVRLNPDVIAVGSSGLTEAVKRATGSIPIVVGGAGDLVGSGLVTSLARPGGNITGLTNISPDLSGKRLELLKEVFVKASRVAVLWYSFPGSGDEAEIKETEIAARTFKIMMQSVPVRGPDEFRKAFAAVVQDNAHALIIISGSFTNLHRVELLELALKHRLPSMCEPPGWANDGCLMSYGPDELYSWRRAAVFVDKILKGARPAELPIEQPTKFALVINLKTAKQIGLTIPPNVLARADKVIR